MAPLSKRSYDSIYRYNDEIEAAAARTDRDLIVLFACCFVGLVAVLYLLGCAVCR